MYGSNRTEKLKLQIRDSSDSGEHFYQDLELLYVLRGALTVKIGEQVTVMDEGDVLLVNADKVHTMRGGADCLYAQLMIAAQLVGDILSNADVMFRCDSSREDGQRYRDLCSLLDQLLDRYLAVNGDTRDFLYISLCYRIMNVLSEKFLISTAYTTVPAEQDRFSERIGQIDAYMRNNYHRAISLKDLSETLYLSVGYLSRFFKKTYGMSFVDYLYNIRLYHAMDDLLYTDESITTIAYESGFPSVAVFDKVFRRRYGETPSSYRKKVVKSGESKQNVTLPTAAAEGVRDYLQSHAFSQDEAIERVELSVDVQSSSPLRRFWEETINACPAQSLLQTEMQEHLLLLHDMVAFEHVRIWDIFSRDMLIDFGHIDDPLNFSRIDSLLDFLVRYHLKPHIELGPKPKRVTRVANHKVLRHTPYPSVRIWKQAVDAFIRHIVSRYGVEEVTDWRVELWLDEYEPLNRKTMGNYLDLFEATIVSCKRYCRGIEVGGCGYTTSTAEEWLVQLIDCWGKRSSSLPDFFSAGMYPYQTYRNDDGTVRGVRSTDERAVLHGIQRLRTLLDEHGFDSVPLYITEWNGSVSARNHMNDTCFKGAYVVRNILDAYGSTDIMAYFSASDRESDFYDSNLPLYGGSGLITKDAIFKPAGLAFSLMNKLFPRFIAKSENALITTNGENQYGIICHNQRELNSLYYRTDEDKIDSAGIGSFFDDRQRLAIKLDLQNVEDGAYLARVFRVNQQFGSVLDMWRNMGYERDLSREDIAYLRKTCEPLLTIEQYSSHNHMLSLDIELEANEVLLLILQRR